MKSRGRDEGFLLPGQVVPPAEERETLTQRSRELEAQIGLGGRQLVLATAVLRPQRTPHPRSLRTAAVSPGRGAAFWSTGGLGGRGGLSGAHAHGDDARRRWPVAGCRWRGAGRPFSLPLYEGEAGSGRGRA
jgi:hypothetical protein